MEFWEFLIQKEGDRSWLPLESPNVEILEGRYRVVARSSKVNTPVEIRIIHDALNEDPPKRRIQKRANRTNLDGLLVVIPYTQLSAGIWELKCSGDLMSDMMGVGWHYGVRLQVISQDIEPAEEWDPDWHQGDDPEAAITHSVVSDPVVSDPADCVETTPETDPESRLSSDQSVSAPASDSPQPEIDSGSTLPLESTEKYPIPDPEHWELILSQSTYTLVREQPLVLSGQLSLSSEVPSSRFTPFEATLTIHFRDPHGAEHLDTLQYDLWIDQLPYFLTYPVDALTTHQTRLILGEVTITYNQDGVPVVLTTQSFTITVNLDELLEAIANDFTGSTSAPLTGLLTSSPNPLDLTFLELQETAPQKAELHPADPHPLPPQLYQADPNQSKQKPLELPFIQPSKPSIETAGVEIPRSADAEYNTSDLAPNNPVAPTAESLTDSLGIEEPLDVWHENADQRMADLPLTVDEQSGLSDPLLADLEADTPLDWHYASESPSPWQPEAPTPVEEELSPEDEAFRALNLHRRFWARLSALATDVEFAKWLQRLDATDPLPSRDSPPSLDSHLVAQEIVVEEDDPIPVETGSRWKTTSHSQQVLEPPQALILPKDEPIPRPELIIPEGELMAGQTVPVTLKLPHVHSRLYVKLWIHDRQSRAVLDGPHWVVDFIPTGLGDRDARTSLTVPFGCLEVQFEAIAVEMATQRESRKVTIDRSVIPPDLPSLMLDELDV